MSVIKKQKTSVVKIQQNKIGYVVKMQQLIVTILLQKSLILKHFCYNLYVIMCTHSIT